MKEIRLSRRRFCLQCGSSRLERHRAGMLSRRYTCRTCDTVFSGIKLFRLRISWR